VPAPAGDTLSCCGARSTMSHFCVRHHDRQVALGGFAGQVTPADYTKRWWSCAGVRGVMPPDRARADRLDPGQVPCARQRSLPALFPGAGAEFQFYRSLCHAANDEPGRCTAAPTTGAKRRDGLAAMLADGRKSRPWPDALRRSPARRDGRDRATRLLPATYGVARDARTGRGRRVVTSNLLYLSAAQPFFRKRV